MTLFTDQKQPQKIPLPDATIHYIPGFISTEAAKELYSNLLENTEWQEEEITVFGKTYWQPRLTALYTDSHTTYTYSGVALKPLSFTNELLELKRKIEDVTNTDFNTCLLNLYRNGQDSNGWHSDNEKELGTNPTIASVSLGATRRFHLKHRKLKEAKYKLDLKNGSLLIMGGTTQHCWLHQISKTKKEVTPRINLTFRKVF